VLYNAVARRPTTLTKAPPYPVEEALERLGANLRTARLRRNLTIEAVAEKIGTGVRAVADAEKGRPGTGGAVYFALLWVYDLLSQLETIADPALDAEGLARLAQRERASTPGKGRLNNDF
jgi:transcriptional regulator with XRE-family HTH domain